MCDAGRRISISGLYISGCTEDGIDVSNLRHVHLSGLNISACGGNGIDNADGEHVNNSSGTGNAEHGIHVLSGSGLA